MQMKRSLSKLLQKSLVEFVDFDMMYFNILHVRVRRIHKDIVLPWDNG